MRKLVYGLIVVAAFGFAALFYFKFYANIEDKMDRFVSSYVENGYFSGAVLVAKGNKIIFKKAYGMANYELNVPNTAPTKFRLASLTKQFTAMAIMILQEKGLLNVNDTVAKYIPDYPNGQNITIHHLLTHTSGIPSLRVLPNYEQLEATQMTSEEIMEFIKKLPVSSAPGEKFNYSGSGYKLLAVLIEKISKKPYEKFLEENIFVPLGMKNSGCDYPREIIRNRASGYSLTDKGLVHCNHIWMSVHRGSGCLLSTVEDLHLWDQALYTEKLVSKKTIDMIFTPFATRRKNYGYGYGWGIGGKECHRVVFHGGRIQGFATTISRFIDDKVSVIVLSNFVHANVEEIEKGLASIALGEPYDFHKGPVFIEVDFEIYKKYAGQYEVGEGSAITVTIENRNFFVKMKDKPKFMIRPITGKTFSARKGDIKVIFEKNTEGGSGIFLEQNNKKVWAKKVK